MILFLINIAQAHATIREDEALSSDQLRETPSGLGLQGGAATVCCLLRQAGCERNRPQTATGWWCARSGRRLWRNTRRRCSIRKQKSRWGRPYLTCRRWKSSKMTGWCFFNDTCFYVYMKNDQISVTVTMRHTLLVCLVFWQNLLKTNAHSICHVSSILSHSVSLVTLCHNYHNLC